MSSKKMLHVSDGSINLADVDYVLICSGAAVVRCAPTVYIGAIKTSDADVFDKLDQLGWYEGAQAGQVDAHKATLARHTLDYERDLAAEKEEGANPADTED